VRVRIVSKPQETEIDGVSLASFVPGTVKDLSSTLGLWLIAQGYAVPEMRHPTEEDGPNLSVANRRRDSAADHPHRRSSDR
jgi:hypothetical protein